jgi:hypothetical protein
MLPRSTSFFAPTKAHSFSRCRPVQLRPFLANMSVYTSRFSSVIMDYELETVRQQPLQPLWDRLDVWPHGRLGIEVIRVHVVHRQSDNPEYGMPFESVPSACSHEPLTFDCLRVNSRLPRL